MLRGILLPNKRDYFLSAPSQIIYLKKLKINLDISYVVASSTNSEFLHSSFQRPPAQKIHQEPYVQINL